MRGQNITVNRPKFWQKFFDQDAKIFPHVQLRESKVYKQLGESVLKCIKKEPVLELGCGDGEFLRHMYYHGCKNIMGLDASEDRVLRARKIVGIGQSIILSNLEYIDKDGIDNLRSFGIKTIVLKEALEHMPDDTWTLMLAGQILSGVKNARLIISFYDFYQTSKWTPSLVHAYSAKSLVSKLKYLGFDLVVPRYYVGEFVVMTVDKMPRRTVDWNRMLKGKGSFGVTSSHKGR